VTAAEAIRATGGYATRGTALPAQLRVSIDTRTLRGGDTFLALRGERFDGHRFVGEAVGRGAVAVVVDDPSGIPPGIPALVVGDTKVAYLALAATARKALRGRVVAITGSTGKTTTKALLVQVLQAAGAGFVAATPANENNEIGVSKLFLGLEPSVDVVVVELGARHYGDIETLVAIARPDVAVLTNVGDAHLAVMGSRERLTDTKWSIFSYGATAVLNASDAVCRERAHGLPQPAQWFDAVAPGVPVSALGVRTTVLRGRDELVIGDANGFVTHRVRCTLPGDHNRANVAAACAAALALGCAPPAVAASIAGLALPEGRYERTRVGDLELIFDAYNASMAGTLATLDAFAHERAERRIAVLASMAELGDGSVAMHERVGAAAARADLTALLVGGEHAHDLERGARAAGIPPERLVRFERNADAVRWLADHARAGDLVLLKGSRMYHLEEVVDGLRGARDA
jgi:UDP-N-acetylmuramoyl-tripeptide--D-alanyl-D-alanine ligase